MSQCRHGGTLNVAMEALSMSPWRHSQCRHGGTLNVAMEALSMSQCRNVAMEALSMSPWRQWPKRQIVAATSGQKRQIVAAMSGQKRQIVAATSGHQWDRRPGGQAARRPGGQAARRPGGGHRGPRLADSGSREKRESWAIWGQPSELSSKHSSSVLNKDHCNSGSLRLHLHLRQ
jgi:hypothetical protein